MITRYSTMTKLTISDTWYAFKTHISGARVSCVLRMGNLRITLGKVCRVDWMRRTASSNP